jgi:hypothetical protein
VHRFQNTVYYKRLEAGQFILLSAFQANATMADACNAAADTGHACSDRGAQIKSWFQTWASLGWFCRLK